MNRRINFKTLAFHILVPIMLLFIILMLVPGYNDYFDSLEKPFPKVPGILFFGIYAFVYFVFGIAAYMVDMEEEANTKIFNYYYISLLINLLYIPIMFGTNNLLVGLLWSVLLLVFVFFSFKSFRKINKTSGILFLIYLVFTIFLVYYSLMIYIINK